MSDQKLLTDREISSTVGRLSLIGIVFLCFLIAMLLTLWLGRGERIHSELKITALGKLASFYVPLFTLMAAFYFGGRKGRMPKATVPIEALIFAVVVVSLWVISPIFLLLSFFIEDVLSALERIKPYGDSLALLAVGYYFSQDHARPRPIPKKP